MAGKIPFDSGNPANSGAARVEIAVPSRHSGYTPRSRGKRSVRTVPVKKRRGPRFYAVRNGL